MESAKQAVFLSLSLFGGAIGSGVSAYICAFVMNLHIPFLPLPTVDGNPYSSPVGHPISSPLWNNLLLFSLFVLQHSFMVRGPVRRLLDLFLDEDHIRVIFVLAASTCLFSLFIFWKPMPDTIWDIQHEPLKMVVYGLNAVFWIGVIYSLTILDPFSLLGIRPLIDKLFNRKSEVHFVTTGAYGLVRHPTYIFLFLAFWVTPTMTVGHLVFALMMTVYTMLAVAYFEEPDLIRIVGPQYEEYMKTTPRYIPQLCPVGKKKET